MLAPTRGWSPAIGVVASALLLAACSDHSAAPAAPAAPDVPPPPAVSAIASTPPALPSAARSSADVVDATRGTTGVSAAALATLSVGANGMLCATGLVGVYAPSPQGTQSYETVWWYPIVWRWDGQRWVQSHDIGWAHARLGVLGGARTIPEWIAHATGARMTGAPGTRVTPGQYYAVQSWVYFEASKQWASSWELHTENTPIAMPVLPTQWCRA